MYMIPAWLTFWIRVVLPRAFAIRVTLVFMAIPADCRALRWYSDGIRVPANHRQSSAVLPTAMVV